MFQLNVPNSPNSCLIKLQHLRLRTLVDTGSEVTLINKRIYDSLKYKVPLKPKRIALQSANGSEINVLGEAELNFSIAGIKLSHNFIVVSNLNRTSIIGRDFLVKNGVRLYFDLAKMRIQNAYVPLENDIHVSSVARLSKKLKMKPRTVYLVSGHIKSNPYFDKETSYELEEVSKGFLYSQPEIEVSPAIVRLKSKNFKQCFPVQITNNSDKHVTLYKGSIIGTLKDVSIVNSIHSNNNSKPKTISNKEFIEQIQVDNENKAEVSEFLLRNKHLFAFSDCDLLTTDILEADIDTGDHEPINLRPYRIPLSQRELVSESIDDMLKAGIIRPSFSPWNFPVVIVDKKPDLAGIKPKPRICIDYRSLNSIVHKKSFPIPLIDDILGNLESSTYFTTLDLRAGFHQIKLTNRSIPKTAFSCFKGKYEYTTMPFGISLAPSYFQAMANKLLLGLEHFAIAYIDDILIYTKGDLQDHLKHVQLVMDRLEKHFLRLKLSKCSFARNEIKYLGFIVNRFGIKPDEEKVKAIKSLKPPTNVRQVRSFLGMCSWYRRFVPNFAKITESLVKLTKKYARFSWNEENQKSFDYLKSSLSCVPLLGYPQSDKPFILYTDASDNCVGAVLVQSCNDEKEWIPNIPNEKPIHFLSHKLSESQIKSYSTSEKEAFAIHYALNKLHYYLYNTKFVIKTDHQPLKYLFSAEQKNRRIQSWALTIGSYNCTIEYLKGTENVCADLLSRSPPANEENIEEEIPQISDNVLQINVINSNKIDTEFFFKN